MTVQQLIEQLETFPPGMEAVVLVGKYCDDQQPESVEGIEIVGGEVRIIST